MDTPTFIDIRGLTKSYAEGAQTQQVLREANLNSRKGEFLAMLGASGSGKSTLLNLLSGIDGADAGTIAIGGQDLTAMSEGERTLFRRKHIGFVFQFFNLLPTLTVIENISLPVELTGAPVADARKKAMSLLEMVNLADRAETFPDRLSGGQQQRVAIARALVHDPMLVLADEPTGNLDQETGTNIMDLLVRLTREAGKNLIMATHNMDNAQRADRILQLREGKLVDAGHKKS
jgi:putative ABC transport system ATP-binding protein